MRWATLFSLWGAVCLAQSEGLPPVWETQKSVQELIDKLTPLGPLLERLDPGVWVEKGAPAVYRDQLKSAQDQFQYVLNTARRLLKQPDSLSLALEAGLRSQSLEFSILSVAEVVRRYQNSAIAELITSQFGESAVHREKLRQYVIALAAAKEQELAVADREAQRCRDILSRQPVTPPKPTVPPKKEVKK
jgi:hypothetical protein